MRTVPMKENIHLHVYTIVLFVSARGRARMGETQQNSLKTPSSPASRIRAFFFFLFDWCFRI